MEQYLPSTFIDRGQLESLLKALFGKPCLVERRLDQWLITVPNRLDEVCRSTHYRIDSLLTL